MTTELSKKLKQTIMSGGAKSIHKALENHPFLLRNLLKQNTFTAAAYRHYLVQLYFIYQSLEQSLEQYRQHDAPEICALFRVELFSQLLRQTALWEDINELAKPPAADEKLALTDSYIRYIQGLSAKQLIAVVYTRYFGDLEGLQFIRPTLVSRLKQVDKSGAHRFFTFYANVEQSQELSRAAMQKVLEAIRTGCFDKIAERHHLDIVTQVATNFSLTLKLFDALNRQHFPASQQEYEVTSQLQQRLAHSTVILEPANNLAKTKSMLVCAYVCVVMVLVYALSRAYGDAPDAALPQLRLGMS
jgi:heme oxygenase